MNGPQDIAQWVLDQCLKGAPWSREDIDAIESHPALFRVLAEGLSDRFDEALVRRYNEIFAYVLTRKIPNGPSESELLARYARVRHPREYGGNGDAVRDVYVLSRVTLGADVAITSVMMDGLKRRFRNATVWLCGDRKSYQLFEGDNRVGYYPIFYERGASLDRVLAERAYLKNGIVVDPDSRISQLGLLPICPEENYYFFESRAYGGDSQDTLSHLAARWMRQTFGVDAKPYIAPRSTKWTSRYYAVSLGVGGNANKGLPPEFERRWLEKISQQGLPVVVDRGAGGEEAERVENATRGLSNINIHKGTFAEFADVISQSLGYFGYDSAGAHVAAVCGVPLTAVFKGHVNERMFERWKPSGAGNATIVRLDEESPDIERVLAALDSK